MSVVGGVGGVVLVVGMIWIVGFFTHPAVRKWDED